MEFRSYANGDRIWIGQRYGQPTVVKFLTHDGLSWEEGEKSHHRLEGVERLFHQIEVFFIKLIAKVLA